MAKILTHETISGAAKDELAEIYDTVILDIEREKVKNAFQHNYLLTSEQARIAASLFDPLYIRQRAGNLIRASHPILNILNDYCDHMAKNHVYNLKSKGILTVSIGDSINNKVGAHHNCLQVDSTREAFRVMGQTQNANVTTPTKSVLQDMACRNTPTYGLCTNGSQNCEFQASHLVGMHCAYDIDPETLYLIFYKHNAQYLINYMFIPYQIYNQALAPLDDQIFNIHQVMYEGKRSYAFTMRDNSIPYIHNKETWNFWAQWTTIRGPTFTLVKEVSNTIGPLQVHTITRVARDFVGEIFATIPFAEWAKGYTLVPNIVQFVKNGMCFKQRELEHILVPSHICRGINSYSIRAQDGSYQFTDVATLASGLMRELVIGEKKYHDRWNVTEEQYNESVISMFLLNALMRTDRTKTVSAVFNELKRLSDQGTFSAIFGDMVTYAKRFVMWVCGELPEDFAQKAETGLDHFNLDKFKYVYLDDIIIRGNTVVKIRSDELIEPGSVVRENNFLLPGRRPDFAKPKRRAGKGILDSIATYNYSISSKIPAAPRQIRRLHICNRCGEENEVWLNKNDDPITYTCDCGNYVYSESSSSSSSHSDTSDDDDESDGQQQSNNTQNGTANSANGQTNNAANTSAVNGNVQPNNVNNNGNTQTNNAANSAAANGNIQNNNTNDNGNNINNGNVQQNSVNDNGDNNNNNRNVQTNDGKTDKPVDDKNKDKGETGNKSEVVDNKKNATSGNINVSQTSANKYKIGNCTITLINGDITDGNHQCYVNATNKNLILGTGVSGAFALKYPNLQNEMSKIGGVQVGHCAITRNDGNGNKLNIIHACGPTKHVDSDLALNQVYINMLDTMVRNAWTDISTCLISAGVFGYTNKESAETFIQCLLVPRYNMDFTFYIKYEVDRKAITDAINDILKGNVSNVNTNTRPTSVNTSANANVTRQDNNPVNTNNISINANVASKTEVENEERAKMPNFRINQDKLKFDKKFSEGLFRDLAFVQDSVLMDEQPDFSTSKAGFDKYQTWQQHGTSDRMAANEIALEQIPTKFRGGHCAMQSVYESYFNNSKNGHKRMAIGTYLRAIRDHLIKSGHDKKYVDLYVIRGNWLQSGGHPNISSSAIGAAADILDCNIIINMQDNTGKVYQTIPVRVDEDRTKDYNIYYSNNHFTYLPNGGARDKFPALLDSILDFKDPATVSNKVWVEISAAPGYLCNHVYKDERLKDFKKYHLIYEPGLKFDKQIMTEMSIAEKQTTAKGEEFMNYLSPYSTLKGLYNSIYNIIQTEGGIGYLVSDAARGVNTEELIDSLHDTLHKFYFKCDSIVYKTFGNPVSTWEYLRYYSNVKTYKTGVGSEVYYFAADQSVPRTLQEMYEEFHQPLTEHVIHHSAQDVYLYAKHFFTGEYKTFIPNMPKTDHTTTFTALTGYASASKTTEAIKRYNGPGVLYVAPTRTLALHHQSLGVMSFTQHIIFRQESTGVKTVVIDELSQFDARYLHVIKVKFPLAKIIVVGDVYQTKGYSSDKKPVTFESVGVCNNMWEVYKVPRDIVDILNKKYGFNMIFKGSVEKGLYSANEKIQDVSKLPIGGYKGKDGIRDLQFIAMNTTTVDEMEKRKIKCNTVTTYTGSRDHTVVFVVDNRAVGSQLTNHREVVYTALTRATTQLVLYGQGKDHLLTAFACNNPLITSLQEANQVRIISEERKLLMENDSKNSMIEKGIAASVVEDKITSTPVKASVATTILDQIIKTDKPVDVFTTIIPAKISAVEEGSLRTTEDVVADTPKRKVVYKVDVNANFVKHQSSDSALETVRTMVKRYAKKNKKINTHNSKLLLSDLTESLAKAIYGKKGKFTDLTDRLTRNATDPNYRHNLAYHYEEYMKSLQQKVNSGSATTNDITGEFEPFDEFLKFFNKNQDKFDPNFNFDKAGQGVAAFSKKVNILFSCYARYILQEIRDECKHSDRIFVATHDDDKGINDAVSGLMKKFKDKFKKFFNCDIGEWDTRFLQAFCSLMKLLLVAATCPKTYADWFYKYRTNWKMKYTGKKGKATLKGKGKQFSGNPFTILENTICNLAFMWAILDIDDFGFALFKGDDSCIYAGKCDFSVKGKRILEMTGHVTKAHTTDSGEFAGYMITEAGIFPDVVRYAAKFLSKHYRDEEHFLQAQEGLKERVRCVVNQNQVVHGCVAMAEHYDGLTPESANLLFDYIKSAVDIKFTDLKELPTNSIVVD